MARKHCHIRLTPDFANLTVLEDFITSCPFLSGEESNRAMLLATEYFDNIVAYSKSVWPGKVDVALERGERILVSITYPTLNFSDMVRASGTTKPYFDPGTGRYRGLGLLMCRNLSTSIEYRKGLLRSSVIIIL